MSAKQKHLTPEDAARIVTSKGRVEVSPLNGVGKRLLSRVFVQRNAD